MSAQHHETAILQRLADVQPEAVQWLWPGRLPLGKLVTLDGDPGLGKSTLALTVAAHLSTGTPWPDGAPCPLGSTLLLSAEDGAADTIRPRLDAAGADSAMVHALTSVSTGIHERPVTLDDVEVIQEGITAVGAKLLVVDVLMAFLPAGKNAHVDQDMRSLLFPIAEMAAETGCTVLLLRNLNKTAGGSAVYRGGGSIGIVGAARAGFMVAPDPANPNRAVLACVKSNLAPIPASLTYTLTDDTGRGVARVVWGESSEHRATELVRPTKNRSKHDQAQEWLKGRLASVERERSGEVKKAAQNAGFSDRTVARAREALEVLVTQEGRTSYWSLPEDGSAKPATATTTAILARGTGTKPADQQECDVTPANHGQPGTGKTYEELCSDPSFNVRDHLEAVIARSRDTHLYVEHVG